MECLLEDKIEQCFHQYMKEDSTVLSFLASMSPEKARQS